MILANVRHRLGRDDAQLAVRLLGRDGPNAADRAETMLREQGIDALLDDPRLLPALLAPGAGMHASHSLFSYVVVRHALRRAGDDDRVMADYVASILLHFGLRGRAERISDTDDECYQTLAELMEDVDDSDPQRSFLVRQHLGNYALWLSGLFPDFIEHRRWRRGGPDLDYYEQLGRRGFQLAADHRLAADHGVATLLATAAQRFPVLRAALNGVSDALFFPRYHSPEKLMRQVKDEARWMLQ